VVLFLVRSPPPRTLVQSQNFKYSIVSIQRYFDSVVLIPLVNQSYQMLATEVELPSSIFPSLSSTVHTLSFGHSVLIAFINFSVKGEGTELDVFRIALVGGVLRQWRIFSETRNLPVF
jgi:hypothetical protein